MKICGVCPSASAASEPLSKAEKAPSATAIKSTSRSRPFFLLIAAIIRLPSGSTRPREACNLTCCRFQPDAAPPTKLCQLFQCRTFRTPKRPRVGREGADQANRPHIWIGWAMLK